MGTALLLAAVDKQGPQLYLIEPSGTGLVRCLAVGCAPTSAHMAADVTSI
jgi:20S proteasome alpha/beta subunit